MKFLFILVITASFSLFPIQIGDIFITSQYAPDEGFKSKKFSEYFEEEVKGFTKKDKIIYYGGIANRRNIFRRIESYTDKNNNEYKMGQDFCLEDKSYKIVGIYQNTTNKNRRKTIAICFIKDEYLSVIIKD